VNLQILSVVQKLKFPVVAVLALGSLYFLLYRLEYVPGLTEIPKILKAEDDRQPMHPLPTDNLASDQALSKLLGDNVDRQKISVLVEKSKYRLTVFYKLQPVKSYPVVFGNSPIGTKLKQGDRKTPEGISRIRSSYPHPSWSKFLWLDYPNAQSWRNHYQAKFSGQIGWFDSIGNELGIHGVPKNSDNYIDQKNNWTWGCVSLKTADIDELYDYARAGTIVEILP
jgi:murein L,D-transpeptidase YafK